MSEQPEKERSGEAGANGGQPLALHAAICSEWIPCETLLPPEGKKVLTYSEAYGMVVGSMDDRHKWGAEHCDYETGEPWLSDEGTVTHWMPLPNPPNDKLTDGGKGE